MTIDWDGEVTVDVLAKGDSALLAVHHLVGLLVGDDPVHDVQREALADGVYDGIALLLVIHELTLILRADVEQTAVADHTLLGVVEVAVGNLTDGDLLQFDFHERHFLAADEDALEHLDSVDDAGSIEVVTSRLPEPGEVRISAFPRRVPPGPQMVVGIV